MRKISVIAVIGTRPEAIKFAPIVKEIQRDKKFKLTILLTSQHKDMLVQALRTFQIRANRDFKIMKENQGLSYITTEVLQNLKTTLEQNRPDMLLVQGDTTTAMTAALAAYYQKIPVAHIEAGLRSFDKYQPYPEEINRRIIDSISELHFAPTGDTRQNLINEGFTPSRIFVTGNTVIDALKIMLKMAMREEVKKILAQLESRKIILVTAHRRENIGKPLQSICMAILKLSRVRTDIQFIFPVHPNPKVRQIVYELLANHKNITLTKPLDYRDFVQVMDKATLILTDSGGIQEEASFLGKPVLVLRNKTEREEGIKTGNMQLIGTNHIYIYESVINLLKNGRLYKTMSKPSNIFGRGNAAKKITKILKNSPLNISYEENG